MFLLSCESGQCLVLSPGGIQGFGLKDETGGSPERDQAQVRAGATVDTDHHLHELRQLQQKTCNLQAPTPPSSGSRKCEGKALAGVLPVEYLPGSQRASSHCVLT